MKIWTTVSTALLPYILCMINVQNHSPGHHWQFKWSGQQCWWKYRWCFSKIWLSSWDIFLETLTPKGTTYYIPSQRAHQDFWIIWYAEFTDMIWKPGQRISLAGQLLRSTMMFACVFLLKHFWHRFCINTCNKHWNVQSTFFERVDTKQMQQGASTHLACVSMFASICVICAAYLLHAKINV